MRFRKIRIQNIRSYKNQEIAFPAGSFLLSGDVGSGKTSVLLALEYALFGLQPGQKGSSLLRNNEQIGEVALELEITGKIIFIERKLKRTPKGVSNEYAAITINGKKIESSLTEVKLKIVNLLGYPHEFVKKNNVLYRYTVHSPQEQMKQIILEDTDTRLNILRHIFSVDKYKQIKENLALLLNNIKNDSKILQGEINALDYDKECLDIRKSKLKTIEENVQTYESDLTEKTRTRKEREIELKEILKGLEEKKLFEQEVEKTIILVVTKKEIIASINKELAHFKDVIREAGKPLNEHDYHALINDMKTKRTEYDDANAEKIEILGRINSLEKEESEILAKKDRIFKIDICPTCLQDVLESHKHNILNETESKLAKIKTNYEFAIKQKMEILTRLLEQKKEITALEDKKMQLEILKSKLDQLEKSRTKVEELERQKKELENDEAMLTNHSTALKERILRYSAFEIQLKRKERELQQALQEEKNSEISLARLKKELELSYEEILLLEKLIQKKEESKRKLYKLNELIDWLGIKFYNLVELIERNVLLKLRSEFSVLFKKWFLMLVSDSSLDAQVDENFTPVIMQGETEMDYAFLSGGERTAVALAYRLALNQIINSLMSKIKTKGLIILDEPTDGFSEAQIDKMRDILDELNAEQLIIVSHEQKIESFVDHVIRVVKNGDVSCIQEEQATSIAGIESEEPIESIPG